MVNTKKGSSKQKWTDKDYYVKQNKYAEYQDVNMYCATNQYNELQFLGTHNKPHGVLGLGAF